MLPIEERRRLQRNDRRVGATADLAPEWIEAVRDAEVPAEFASLDADLR